MTVYMVDKSKFGCPRCGGREFITVVGPNKVVYDDQGNLVSVNAFNSYSGIQLREDVCANPRCGAMFVLEHCMPGAKQIPAPDLLRRILRDVAECGGTISYRDLTLRYKRITGFWIDHRLSWNTALLVQVHDSIKRQEMLLAALVINEEFGMPGEGFPWHLIGVTSENPKVRWKAWKGYKRRVHRYFFNRRYRPWMVTDISYTPQDVAQLTN